MAPGGNGRPQQQRRGEGSRPAGGAQKRNGAKAGKAKKGKTSLKSMIRGWERLLAKPDLDPKARAATEAKMAKMQAEHEQHKREELERKMAVKYHKVKFFDRVKADRNLKQLQSKLKQAVMDGEEELVAEIKPKLDIAKDHVMYVKHFPKAEKFVSLYKGDGEEIEAERKRLMEIVQREQRDLAIMTEADEGMGGPEPHQDEPSAPEAAAAAETPSAPSSAARGSRRKKAQPSAASEEPASAASEAPAGEAEAAPAVKKSSRRKKAADVAEEKAGAPAVSSAPAVSASPESEPTGSARAVMGSKAKKEEPAQEAPMMPADDFLMAGDDFFMADDGADEEPEEAIQHTKKVVPVPKPDPQERYLTSSRPQQPKKAQRRDRSENQPPGKGAAGVSKPKHSSSSSKIGSGRQERPQKDKDAPTRKISGKEKPVKASAAVSAPAADKAKLPLRSRADGGRKRRGKKKD